MTAPAFRATRGDSLTWTFTIPENITGWTPRWVLKPVANWPSTLDAAATIVATTGGQGLVSTPGASSTVDLTVLASVTAAWEPGVYVWDLQLTNGTSVRTVEWDTDGNTVGTLTIVADVTRTTP
jgi:hypothetical protein